MGKKTDLTGQRFGHLVVLYKDGRDKCGHVMWRCKCDCEAVVTVLGSNLGTGRTTSCGCYKREKSSERIAKRNTTHGMTKTKLFRVWRGILQRTGVYRGTDEKHKRDYLDRGITVCDEWLVFENFRDWALPHGYSEGLQIDRIDNDKGYCPNNCRFVSRRENLNNRRCTIRLEDGTSLAMFCSEIGIQTSENNRISNQYSKIRYAYIRHHKAHPELIQKANNLIALYRKCVEMLKLIAEVKQLRQNLTK